MWWKAPVVMVLALCWAAPASTAEMGEEPDICAMTDVLVAMKQLLVLLSTEIRDLRQQVKTSCQAGDGAVGNDTSPATTAESLDGDEPLALEDTKPEEANSTKLTDDDDDFGVDLDDTFTLEVEKEEKEEDFNYDDVEENPVSEVITGLANWWDNFSPFAPEPATTPASPTTQPDEDEDKDKDQYEEEEEDVVDADEDDDDDLALPTQRPLRPRPTTTTTTTTTPLPYTLPPAPTWCPSPFQLLADGCYLVVHDSREWRSWGEAYAFCQSYRGELAAPWRLPQLQEYLSPRFSDAFWVGARFVSAGQKWEWLTGRRVEQGEWRPSQPHRNPGKKCVFLDKWSGYRANNFFCGEKYPFICESKAT